MNKKKGLCTLIFIISTLFLAQTTSPRYGGGWGWGWGLGWGLGWGGPWWGGYYGYPYSRYPYDRYSYRDRRYVEDREDRAYRAGLRRGREQAEKRIERIDLNYSKQKGSYNNE